MINKNFNRKVNMQNSSTGIITLFMSLLDSGLGNVVFAEYPFADYLSAETLSSFAEFTNE